MNDKIKLIFKGLLGFSLYFIISFCQALPFELMNIDINNIPMTFKKIYNLFCEGVIIISVLLLFKDEIKASFNDLKKNHLNYFKKYFKYYIIALVVMMASNAFIFSINGGNIAQNEEQIRELFTVAPIYTYVSAVVLAPLLEELIFRLSLKNILGRNWGFIIASGLIFGFLHIVGSYTNPTDLLYLIPYGSFGVAFAYMLTKTNNIFVSMGFHLMHNGVIMSLQILTYLIA